MSRHRDIKEDIEREYINLKKKKGKTRGRALQRILLKQQWLNEHLEEFESIVAKYEHRINIKDWNNLTDDLELVMKKVQLSLKILDNQEVIKEKRKRRKTDNCVESQTQQYDQIVFEYSQIEDNSPLSSTLLGEDQVLEKVSSIQHVANLR